MPRRFSNRKAKEYKAVLTAFGYSIVGYNGDDQIWKRKDCAQTVRVPDRDNEEIIIPTSMEMLRKIATAGKQSVSIYLPKDWISSHGSRYKIELCSMDQCDGSDNYFTITSSSATPTPSPATYYSPSPSATPYYSTTPTPVETPSPSATPYYSTTPTPTSTVSPTQTRIDAITQLYITLLRRTPDQSGLNFWVNSSYTIDQIRTSMMNSSEYYNLNYTAPASSSPSPSSSPSSSPTSYVTDDSITAAIWNAIREYFRNGGQ